MTAFDVRVSPAMADMLRELKAKGHQKSARMLYNCLRRLVDQMLKEHAGHQTHTLSGPLRAVIYRVKQGRSRIFYTCCPTKRVAILIDVLYRKAGDSGDAYLVLNERVRAGWYDESLAECGHARPAV